MKRNYAILTCLILLFASCNQKNEVNINKVSFLTEDNIPALQQLDFEKIELPEEECMNSSFFVYNDSILIILPRNPDTYVMSIMSMHTKKIIGRYLHIGNGPGESGKYCSADLRQNRIIVQDGQKKILMSFNLDSAIMLGNNYRPLMTQLMCDTHSFDIFLDNTFLLSNIWYLDDCGNKINEDEPELLIAKINDVFDYKAPEKAEQVMLCNYTTIASNIERNKVFITYEYKPQFTLLNTNLDTIKIIIGPDPLKKQEYKKNVTGISPQYITQYGGHVVTTNDFVFVRMRRLIDVPSDKYREESKKNRPEIFMFDWDGNLLARYNKLKGNKIFSIAGYSETNNILYINSKDENDEISLYKVQL